MYCWDALWSLPPSLTRGVEQGLDTSDSQYDWVPCGVIHHGGAPLSFTERLRRIAIHWWYVGRRRPPWRPAEDTPTNTFAPGAMEEAWAELDSPDPDLEWV